MSKRRDTFLIMLSAIIGAGVSQFFDKIITSWNDPISWFMFISSLFLITILTYNCLRWFDEKD